VLYFLGRMEGISRRTFMAGAGATALATVLGALPDILAQRGLLAEAAAQSADYVTDTLSALVAFILPGNDEYSTAQGTPTSEPGGIAAGTVPVFIDNLDNFVPAAAGPAKTTIPASGGVSTLLNNYALQVNPGASNGPFLSPFARLSFAEKAEVFKRFEADPGLSAQVQEFRFVSGILPGFVAFLAFSEAGVLDPATRQPKSRPVGWQLTNFVGPAEGHAEYKGYYEGRRSVRGTPRRKAKHKRRRRRRRARH
jgi:TAT (twin-arginine translocation) pathway signal sequence